MTKEINLEDMSWVIKRKPNGSITYVKRNISYAEALKFVHEWAERIKSKEEHFFTNNGIFFTENEDAVNAEEIRYSLHILGHKTNLGTYVREDIQKGFSELNLTF